MLFFPLETFAAHFQQKSLLRGISVTMEGCPFIYPIPKSGNKNDIANYWPTVILNVISKLIDTIVAQLLSSALLNKLVLEHHRFLKGRSTLTNLIIYCDLIINLTKTHRQIDSLYFGF